MGSLGWPELLLILGIAVLLFGTTKLAGLGKASGRAIREFKEETQAAKKETTPAPAQQLPPATPEPQQNQAPLQADIVAPEPVADPNQQH